MSHHGNDPAKIANLVKLNTYHVELFGKFLAKLSSTPDGDGSLLDHSMILYGSGMSESNTHSRLDVPTTSLAARPADQGQPPHQDAEGNSAGESDAGIRAEVRRRDGKIRHQHRQGRM